MKKWNLPRRAFGGHHHAIVGSLVSLLVFPMLLRGAEGNERVLTVCQLLKDLSSYQNRRIRLRAVVGENTYHGDYLKDADQGAAETSCPGLRKWPAGIAVVWPKASAGTETPGASIPKKEQVARAWSAIDKHARDVMSRKVTAIFVGRIESRKGIKILRIVERGEPLWIGDGYGHSGQFPAQLLVQSMTDVWVEYQGQRKRIDDETEGGADPGQPPN